MLRFHQGNIKLTEKNNQSDSVLYSFFKIEPLANPICKQVDISKIKNSIESSKKISDNEIYSEIMPLIKCHQTMFLFLYLIKHSDQDLYITDLESLSKNVLLERDMTLASLAILEEFQLIKIEGKKLIKIKIASYN